MSHHVFFFLMIRRPPRYTLDRSSAASDVYKRQIQRSAAAPARPSHYRGRRRRDQGAAIAQPGAEQGLSLIHISEPTRPY